MNSGWWVQSRPDLLLLLSLLPYLYFAALPEI
jgi:hypothetical protein